MMLIDRDDLIANLKHFAPEFYFGLVQDIVERQPVVSAAKDDGNIMVQLDDNAYPPERAHKLDAGYDLRTPVNVTVPAHGSAVIDTGVHMLIPAGYVGFLKSKSGLNVLHDLTGTGTIDAGYTGSIRVKLYNHGDTPHEFKISDKIIQIVLLPIYTPKIHNVYSLPITERGTNGFGSTGR